MISVDNYCDGTLDDSTQSRPINLVIHRSTLELRIIPKVTVKPINHLGSPFSKHSRQRKETNTCARSTVSWELLSGLYTTLAVNTVRRWYIWWHPHHRYTIYHVLLCQQENFSYLRRKEPLHNPATVDVEQVLTESLFSKRVYLVTTPEVLEVVLQLWTRCSVYSCTAGPGQAEATQSAAPWPELSWAQSRSSPASHIRYRPGVSLS